jgi:HSP20 family protein
MSTWHATCFGNAADTLILGVVCRANRSARAASVLVRLLQSISQQRKEKKIISNITVRSDGGEARLPPSFESMTPSRIWRDLLRWDPFAEMLPRGEERPALFTPNFDVKETKAGFLFRADLPGCEPKDVDILVTDNRLTVSGKREEEKEEKTDTTYRCERSFGSFTRSFTLPSGADPNKIDADLKQGVLTIKVPRRPEARAKQIAIKSS